MKKVLFITLALILALGTVLMGCAPKTTTTENSTAESASVTSTVAETSTTAPAKQLVFGFLFCGLNTPSVKAGQEAAEARAKELGVKLLVMDGEFDAQKQTDQALNLISQKVDGIIINPNDAQAFVPVAKQIKEAGIPLISWVQPLPTEADAYVNVFIGPDDTKAGGAAMDTFRKAFPDTQQIKIVEIEGAISSIASQKRHQGLQDAVTNSKDFDLLESQATKSWGRDEAMTIMENYLTKYKDIQAVYCHDDNIAQGACEAIKAANRPNIVVVGINGESSAFDSIKAGQQYGTFVQHIKWGAAMCIDVLIGLNEGKTYDKWIVDEWEPVTKDNVNTAQPAW